MNKSELMRILDDKHFIPAFYSLDSGLANDHLCLSQEGAQWCVYYTEQAILRIGGACDLDIGALLGVGEQFGQLARRQAGKPEEKARQTTFRVEAVPLGQCDQRVESRDSARRVVAGEQPILATDRDALQRPLGDVVVDVEALLSRVDVQVKWTPNFGPRGRVS